MISFQHQRRASELGQSLLETALLLPLLLVLVFNAVNFGYFFVVALHLASAPRAGVEYSIQGFSTPAALQLPDPGPTGTEGTVSRLTLRDMSGLLNGSAAVVRVCSTRVDPTSPVNNPGQPNQTAKCVTYNGAATFSSPDADRESPLFVLNRVDVQYTFTPLINASPFGIPLTPTLTFHRQVSMRSM